MERPWTAATTSCSSEANRLGQNGETVSWSSGGNGIRRVHWEPAGLDGTAETGSGVLQYEGNGLLFDRLRSKWGAIDREGCGVPQNGGNRLVLERLRSKRAPVHREGCGVPRNGLHGLLFIHHLLPRSNLHLLLFIHHRLPPACTCYCSSTVDFLQPPPATVHPRGPIHPASIGYCSTSPPRGPIHQPSTGYCSWSLHGVRFIHPPPASSIGVMFI